MKKYLLLFLILPIIVFSQKSRIGEYTLKFKGIEGQSKRSYSENLHSDELISIVFYPSITSIGFTLDNLSDETLKIIWDDAAIITLSGNTERIFHNGIKYIDRDKPQASTSVYKGAKIRESVTPISNAYFSSGTYGGWRVDSFLPIEYAMTLARNNHKYSELIDKGIIRLALPILYKDQKKEYIFDFEVVFTDKPSKKKKEK